MRSKAINLSGETSKIYVAEEAELILEDGKINASNYYGIYSDNGKIVMNGGSIEAYYSCVTSNGTTGKLEFEMNGGTLTSTYGPAMYIPSPATITIKDGTINYNFLFKKTSFKVLFFYVFLTKYAETIKLYRF